MVVLAIFPCLYFLPLSFSFSENLVKKLKLQIIDTCMYAHTQKYQITAAYRPVMAYRVLFFSLQHALSAYTTCFLFTLPLDIQKSTVSKVSAKQNIKKHKATKFRSHFTCRDKVQNDIFSEGCLNNQKLTHRVSTWHKNQWYQLIWQPMGRSRCEQRLSVKALQNIPSLRGRYSQRDTSSMSLLKGQRKPWTVEFWANSPSNWLKSAFAVFTTMENPGQWRGFSDALWRDVYLKLCQMHFLHFNSCPSIWHVTLVQLSNLGF